MRYCLIGDPKGIDFKSVCKADLRLSGLYLWSKAFNENGTCGDVQNIWRQDDLEEFDIIHVNYTPSNQQLITVIKDELKDSSTKIVINVDLDIKYWGVNWAYNITLFEKELALADKLFHVESKGANMLSKFLKLPVHTIPHPVDVSNIYDHIKLEREPIIGTIFHRYFPNTVIPYITQKDIPLRRVLFGYMPVGKTPIVANAGMFDQIIPHQSFQEHIDEVAKCQIGCDLYEGYTYGRSIVEFAALGVPAVVSSTVEASSIFPYTTVEPYDTDRAKQTFRDLYNDKELCEEVITTAHNGCKDYSLKASYNKFIKMMEGP